MTAGPRVKINADTENIAFKYLAHRYTHLDQLWQSLFEQIARYEVVLEFGDVVHYLK